MKLLMIVLQFESKNCFVLAQIIKKKKQIIKKKTKQNENKKTAKETNEEIAKRSKNNIHNGSSDNLDCLLCTKATN